MLVKFKEPWQDGLYKYTVGKLADIPATLAMQYIEQGKCVLVSKKKRLEMGKDRPQKEKIPAAGRWPRRAFSTDGSITGVTD